MSTPIAVVAALASALVLGISSVADQWYLRRASPRRPKVGLMLTGVAATTAGIAGFLAIGQPSAGRTQARLAILPPLAVGIVMTAYHVPQTGDAGVAPATGQGYG